MSNYKMNLESDTTFRTAAATDRLRRPHRPPPHLAQRALVAGRHRHPRAGPGIVLEATLSFLGLGIQPPTPSWGGMVYEGRDYLDSAWWISTFPGLILMLTSLVVSRTGDWLRDLLDPTLRGE